MQAKTNSFVLWGSHPEYVGGEPIKLTAGTLADCRRERGFRVGDGRWILGIYAAGIAPTGLRLAAQWERI